MALIRLQNKVPITYPDSSRDFQLLCRLYDVLLNGVKYDVDGVERLISSHDCNSNILKLLQTKLGFFSDKEFTDTTLRYILQCFPILVKKKGTKLAVEEAVHVFLKINGVETSTKIDWIEDVPTKEQTALYGAQVTDHCVVIGIESSVRDVTPLREILKYIIPFGYNIFFYFFVGQQSDLVATYTGSAKLILISDDVNSMAGSVPIIKKKGTYKDWLDSVKFNILESVTESKTIRTYTDLKSITNIFGVITNSTKDESCKIVKITKLPPEGETEDPIYEITLDKEVTWYKSNSFSYDHYWYTEDVEQTEIAAINTVEAETIHTYGKEIEDATNVLGDVVKLSDIEEEE